MILGGTRSGAAVFQRFAVNIIQRIENEAGSAETHSHEPRRVNLAVESLPA
jgi:hypothetical protein